MRFKDRIHFEFRNSPTDPNITAKPFLNKLRLIDYRHPVLKIFFRTTTTLKIHSNTPFNFFLAENSSS